MAITAKKADDKIDHVLTNGNIEDRAFAQCVEIFIKAFKNDDAKNKWLSGLRKVGGAVVFIIIGAAANHLFGR